MTVYDYIRAKWPNHASRICEEAMRQDKGGAEYVLCCHNPAWHNPELLAKLFVWSNTPEGWWYWDTLLRNGEEVSLKGRRKHAI